MGVVASHAVFRDRRMLISERPAILCMAAQAELIYVRRLQIVSRRPAMGVMAIHTAHLAFTHRVVIWHAHLRSLCRMTFQASVVGLRPGAEHHVVSGDTAPAARAPCVEVSKLTGLSLASLSAWE